MPTCLLKQVLIIYFIIISLHTDNHNKLHDDILEITNEYILHILPPFCNKNKYLECIVVIIFWVLQKVLKSMCMTIQIHQFPGYVLSFLSSIQKIKRNSKRNNIQYTNFQKYIFIPHVCSHICEQEYQVGNLQVEERKKIQNISRKNLKMHQQIHQGKHQKNYLF